MQADLIMRNKVLALLSARYKSLWRLLWGKGGVMPVIGLLIGISILALVTLGCAWAMIIHRGPAAGRIGLAALVITALHLLTLLSAGMGGRLGIFNDPRPLQPYPLTPFDWALAASLGQALDFGTGYALAGMIGLSLGLALFSPGSEGLFAVPILLIGHLVLAVQVAGLSGIAARLSRSRRFRDGAQLFGVLLSVGMTALYFWFVFPHAGGRPESTGFSSLASLLEPVGYLSFSGALLKTQAALLAGRSGAAALGGAAALFHLLLALGLILLAVRMALRESGRGGGGIVRSRALAFILRPLPWNLAAFLAKDLSYLRREPGLAGRLGGSLLNSLLLIAFIALWHIPTITGFYYFLMAMSAHGAARMIFYNQWGYEGPGIRFLLSSGAPPLQLLISKWLMGFTVILIDAGLKALVLWWLLPGSASQWLLYGMILALAPVGAALGGYISLRQPWPMLGRGRLRGRQQLFDWAMVPVMMGMRAVFLFTALPILALWWMMSGTSLMAYAPFALLCALGYALALAVAAIPFLAKQFELRRPELMEALSLPEESI
jgi:hypothetical protein